MKVAIASDHAGFDQKPELVDYMKSNGVEVADLGPDSADRVDYPDFAEKVARAVAAGEAERGVLICGTGIGMSMAANKVDGIRAAAVTMPKFAELSRQHNDANVLCLSARFVSAEINKECIDVFLNTDFEGGRHTGRVEKIMALEK